jgi:hypothetical protein
MPGEPNADRGFLHFSREVRYVVERGANRGANRATCIEIGGVPLDRILERTFNFACIDSTRRPSFDWEAQVARRLDLPIFDLSALPHEDTPLVMREEMLGYIREHGGVTAEGGATHDGRLRCIGS